MEQGIVRLSLRNNGNGMLDQPTVEALALSFRLVHAEGGINTTQQLVFFCLLYFGAFSYQYLMGSGWKPGLEQISKGSGFPIPCSLVGITIRPYG